MPRKRSLVWNHFTKIEEGRKAVCSYCSKVVSIRTGCIGNLKRHIHLKHPTIDFSENESYPRRMWPIGKEVVINVNEGGSDYVANKSTLGNLHKPSLETNENNDSFRKSSLVSTQKLNLIDEQLLRMIVKENHSFSLVEDPEFKMFINFLCPSYNLPTKKIVSNTLFPQVYNAIVEKVSTQLQEATAVSLTIEYWSSINNKCFMTVLAHYINSAGELKSIVLGCTECRDENLSVQLIEIVCKWGLEKKVVAVVCNSISNITEGIRLCKWQHIHCFAYSLNAIVLAGLCNSGISNILNKIRSIVMYFQRSTQALDKLVSVQKQMELPELKLKHDVVSLFLTTYKMIKQILQIKDAVVFTLTILKSDVESLTPYEWNLAESTLEVFQVFVQVAEEISSEKVVSLSKIILFVQSMNKRLLSFENNKIISSEINSVIAILKEQLHKHFGTIEENEMSTQATLLDPRFKKYGFSNDDKFLKTCACLEKELNNKEDRKVNVLIRTVTKPTSSNSPSSSLWEEFDCQVQEVVVTNTNSSPGIVELEKYLQEDLLDRTEDPLKWWKERSIIYPQLYEMVKKRMCIPASTVPSEMLFSKSGQTIINRKRNLTTSRISQIMFLSHNL